MKKKSDAPTPAFRKAIKRLTRGKRYMATVYAMNTLLTLKGIYSAAEFQRYFCEFAEKYGKRRAKGRRK